MSLFKWISNAVRAVRLYFQWQWKLENLQGENHVSPFMKIHLEKLYLTLCGTYASLALGFYLPLTKYFRVPVSVLGFGYLVCIIWFHNVNPWNTGKRIPPLITGALCGGASLGALSAQFLHVNPDYVVAALLAMSLVCGCLCVTSKLVQRWDPFFIRLQSRCNSGTLLISLLGTLLGCVKLDLQLVQYQIWLVNIAFTWFMVYVAAYNLDLVPNLRGGDQDYVNHAITFFTNFPAVSFRLLHMMYKDAHENRGRIVHYLSCPECLKQLILQNNVANRHR